MSEHPKPLEDVITDTIELWEIRRGYLGRSLAPTEKRALRSMLLTALQHNLARLMATSHETESEDSQLLENLDRAYGVIKALIRKHTVGATATLSEEDLWAVSPLYLEINTNGATQTFSLIEEPPENED